MKTKKLKFSTLMLVLGMSTAVFGQKATVAGGGDASGSGGSVSYSIGQVDYINATGTGGSALQGNQQPFEISLITGFDIKTITLDFVVYPNPTADNLTLKVSGNEYHRLNYSLFNMEGKLIKQQDVIADITNISLAEFAKGAYIVTISNENKTIKSYNIIKN